MKNLKSFLGTALLLLGFTIALFSFTNYEVVTETSNSESNCQCYYDGKPYSSGAVSCQGGYEYKCHRDAEDNHCEWYETGNRCGE